MDDGYFISQNVLRPWYDFSAGYEDFQERLFQWHWGCVKRKKCLQACAKCVVSHHPAHEQSLIRAFVFHWYILYYPMVLTADDEGPDQTVRICRLFWVCCPHMPEGTFLHSRAHLCNYFFLVSIRICILCKVIRATYPSQITLTYLRRLSGLAALLLDRSFANRRGVWLFVSSSVIL